MNNGPRWVENWTPAIAQGALGYITGELASAVNDAEDRPLKALGDFDEVRPLGEAMNEKCGPRHLTVRLAYVVNRGAYMPWTWMVCNVNIASYGYYWPIARHP